VKIAERQFLTQTTVVPILHNYQLDTKASHNHAHQRGLAFSVSADKGHLLATAYFYLSIREDNLLTIAYLHVHRFVGDVTGTWSRREFHGKSRLVFKINFYPFQFLKLLYTRLDLI
jgi:hypothetical protein